MVRTLLLALALVVGGYVFSWHEKIQRLQHNQKAIQHRTDELDVLRDRKAEWPEVKARVQQVRQEWAQEKGSYVARGLPALRQDLKKMARPYHRVELALKETMLEVTPPKPVGDDPDPVLVGQGVLGARARLAGPPAQLHAFLKAVDASPHTYVITHVDLKPDHGVLRGQVDLAPFPEPPQTFFRATP